MNEVAGTQGRGGVGKRGLLARLFPRAGAWRMLALLFGAMFFLYWAPGIQTAQAVEDGDVVVEGANDAVGIWGLGEELAEWAKKHEGLFSIIKWITDIWTMLKEWTGELEETWASSTKAQITAREMKMRTQAVVTDAMIDARYNDVVLSEKLRKVAENTLPPASEQFLCNLIVARQVVPILTEFARILSYNIGRGLNEWYRCADCDGNGPQYTADAQNAKCARAGKNWPKTGTLRSGDPLECREDGNGSNTEYADKDLSADTLSLDKVFTVPPIKDVETKINGQKATTKDFVPDEGDEAQRQWIVARRFCYNIAGPRLTPPQGKSIDTPAGKTEYARFASCLAKQNDFLEACRNRLARLTRPNCNQDEWKVFCEASTAACAAAKEAQITLPADIKCAEGLSLQQAEVVSNALCGSNRRIQADGHSGSTDDKRQRVLAMCNVMKEAWERRMAKDDREFLASVIQLQEMKECWE